MFGFWICCIYYVCEIFKKKFVKVVGYMNLDFRMEVQVFRFVNGYNEIYLGKEL